MRERERAGSNILKRERKRGGVHNPAQRTNKDKDGEGEGRGEEDGEGELRGI